MSEITLQVNGSQRKIDVPADTPLLWVLRDTLDLTGTKYGCGAGLCGACTVHLDGQAVRSCVTPVSLASGKVITTIEGLSSDRTASLATGLDRRRRAPVRLLPVGPDHAGGRAAGKDAASLCTGNHRRDDGQPLPLWYLSPHTPRYPARSIVRREWTMSPISRRQFLVGGAIAGTGLVLAFYIPHHGLHPVGEQIFTPNAYLHIAPDGKVTVVVARSEMGQGVRTSLPMILAEELDADWSQIAIQQAGASTLFGDQSTGGSASVRTTWDPMRQAGAAAREMLVTAAAQQWNVPASECTTEKGFVIHAASNRRSSYGDLVEHAAKLPVPKEPKLKATIRLHS